MSTLIEDLLAKPVPTYQKKEKAPSFTNKLEISGGDASVEVTGAPEEVGESLARKVLRDRGENPDLWVATKFESSDRELSSGDILRSNKFTFARIGTRSAQLAQQDPAPAIDWDSIEEEVKGFRGLGLDPKTAGGESGYIVAVADAQLGKTDGDGVAGALQRTIEYLNQARSNLENLRYAGNEIGHVHIPFLGDMLEGYVSQNGANAWRTDLTPGEQFRLVRRIMLHALEIFADSAPKVSMAAVPGNHDQTIRFQGKGTTRYDDSWDVEALISVSDAAKANPALSHIEFLVPDTDEMTVVTEVAGTIVGHAHGHQFKPGRHFDWWKGQSFGGSNLADCDLLLVGHLHHELMETDGRRTFLQAPSLESESTWFRHGTGTIGNPGLLTCLTRNGRTHMVDVIR